MSTQALRCTHCGAPLPQPHSSEEYVKCEYCGFTNRVTDSRAYLELLKREVVKWLNQLLPQTISTASTTVDPLARHHLFQAYVKPTLVPVSVNAKTRFIEVVYSPLTALKPLSKVECGDPKNLFEDSVKLEAVGELAVSDEDRVFVSQTRSYLQTAAFLCNALRDAAEEKFTECVNSIETAADYLPEEREVLRKRLKLAKSFYTVLSEILRRNPSSAVTIAREAEKVAEELAREAGEAVAALELEVDFVKIARVIAEVSNAYFESGLDPLQPYAVFKRVLKLVAENAEEHSRPFKDVVAVTEEIGRALSSRVRKERVRVWGSGSLLVPFYVVEVGVAYTQGLLFKKGRDFKTRLLVSAAHPVVRGVSDIFGIERGARVYLDRESYYAQVVDKMIAVDRIVSEAVPAASAGRVILPLVSYIVAEKLADQYMNIARDRSGGRIKQTSTAAVELLYVAGSVESGNMRLPDPIVASVVKLENLDEITV
ncbi:MAG: hypothetical protein RMI56_02545 [Sulfolobales archaeon]|nr:hypothetical protein [Sulfolobales archaeon]